MSNKDARPNSDLSIAEQIRRLAATIRSEGREPSVAEITETLGCHRQQVSKVLGPRGAGGAPRKLTDDQVAELKRDLKPPRKWTGREISAHIQEKYGIAYAPRR